MNNAERLLAKAQRLMTDGSFWDKVDEHSASFKGANKIVESPEAKTYNSGKQYNLLDEQYMQSYQEDNNYVPGSGLPEELRESFKKMPPIQYDDTSVLSQIPNSFLEGLNGTSQQMQREARREQTRQVQQPVQRQRINEQTLSYSNSGGIDYNYIKYLVQEAIKETMKSMPLNESTSGGNIAAMKLVNGNTFQFMDSKGQIYEAKLKRIK